MSKPRRNPRSWNRTFPVAFVLALLVFWAAMPPPAAGCGMSLDPAPSGSVAAPDCCTDGSCPQMSVEVFHPEGIVNAPPAFAPSVSLVAAERLSPTAISPLAPLAAPPFGHAFLRSPLRI